MQHQGCSGHLWGILSCDRFFDICLNNTMSGLPNQLMAKICQGSYLMIDFSSAYLGRDLGPHLWVEHVSGIFLKYKISNICLT